MLWKFYALENYALENYASENYASGNYALGIICFEIYGKNTIEYITISTIENEIFTNLSLK
jgi:hypothetical protein